MKKIKWLYNIIGFLQWKLGIYKYRIELVPNNPKPENIKKNVVYIVGSEDYVKWAYIKCPDNCGENIMLNLSSKRKPSWTVKRNKYSRATLNPSIHKLDGCKSHFWIKNGKIKWVE